MRRPGTTSSTPRQEPVSATDAVATPLRSWPAEQAPSQGRRGFRTDRIPDAPPPRTGRAQSKEGHMPTEAKRESVAELREALSSSRTLIVSEYRGLTVKELAEIRRALRKQD